MRGELCFEIGEPLKRLYPHGAISFGKVDILNPRLVPLFVLCLIMAASFAGFSNASAEVPKKDVPLDDYTVSAQITDHGVYAAHDKLYDAYDTTLYEKDVVDCIESALWTNGSDYQLAFTTICAAGADSAIPHGDPYDDSSHQIMPGDVVIVDFGARKNGVCGGDVTRTFFMGQPPEEARYIYELTLQAYTLALANLKAGNVASSVDLPARQYFTDHYYGPYFQYLVGHGVGYQNHVSPFLAPNSTEILKDGDHVAVEPGLGLSGEFGVRVEDDFLVTTSGYTWLTLTPYGLDDCIIYPHISFSRAAYSIPGTVEIIVHETDFNTNHGGVDTVDIDVTSTTETTAEKVTLTETGADTSVFKGTISLAAGTPVHDGTLQTSSGDTITAQYSDPSPPVTRTVTAKADTSMPSVSNRAVTAEVGSAAMSWNTSEPANATVFFGTSTSLGSMRKAFGPKLGEKVTISGLSPKTKYYYDIVVWDEAGNMHRDDNSGLHYSFTTQEGAVALPPYRHDGYLRSDNLTDNFFESIRVYSGNWGSEYLGAAQCAIPAIPPDATITGATVSFWGVEWYSPGTGSWALELLNDSIDSGWSGILYNDLKNAPLDETVPPTLTQTDLGPRQWTTFTFTAGQLGNLKHHIALGKASFRVTCLSGSNVVYNWASGYFTTSSGDVFRPYLTIYYTTPVITAEYSLMPAMMISVLLLVSMIAAARRLRPSAACRRKK